MAVGTCPRCGRRAIQKYRCLNCGYNAYGDDPCGDLGRPHLDWSHELRERAESADAVLSFTFRVVRAGRSSKRAMMTCSFLHLRPCLPHRRSPVSRQQGLSVSSACPVMLCRPPWISILLQTSSNGAILPPIILNRVRIWRKETTPSRRTRRSRRRARRSRL